MSKPKPSVCDAGQIVDHYAGVPLRLSSWDGQAFPFVPARVGEESHGQAVEGTRAGRDAVWYFPDRKWRLASAEEVEAALSAEVEKYRQLEVESRIRADTAEAKLERRGIQIGEPHEESSWNADNLDAELDRLWAENEGLWRELDRVRLLAGRLQDSHLALRARLTRATATELKDQGDE